MPRYAHGWHLQCNHKSVLVYRHPRTPPCRLARLAVDTAGITGQWSLSLPSLIMRISEPTSMLPATPICAVRGGKQTKTNHLALSSGPSTLDTRGSPGLIWIPFPPCISPLPPTAAQRAAPHRCIVHVAVVSQGHRPRPANHSPCFGDFFLLVHLLFCRLSTAPAPSIRRTTSIPPRPRSI